MRKLRVDDTSQAYSRLEESLVLQKIENILMMKDSISKIGQDSSLALLSDFNSGNFDNINLIRPNLDEIVGLAQSQSAINALYGRKNKLDDIYNSLDTLIKIPDSVKHIQDMETSMCIQTQRSLNFYKRSRESLNYIDKLYNNKFHPDIERLSNLEARLSLELSDAVKTIDDGHEKAYKFLNYRTIIKPCIMSYEEGNFMTIDDANKQIIFNIPRPICATTRPKVTKQEIIDACGSCGGDIDFTIPTQAEVEARIGVIEAPVLLEE